MMRFRSLLVSGFAIAALALTCPASRACDSYYVLIFGSQRTPNRAKYTHTFATFVKVTDEGPGRCSFEAHTISWLPQTLDVRIYALLPECGANFELHDTLRFVLSEEERVSVWGPYQAEKELYDRAIEQIAWLEEGKVHYKAVDSGYPTWLASNCIHAVADINREALRLRVFSPGFGEVASYAVARRLTKWLIDPNTTHDWVLDMLDLRCYPLIRRDWERPEILKRSQFPR